MTEQQARRLLLMAIAEAIYTLAGGLKAIGKALEAYARTLDA